MTAATMTWMMTTWTWLTEQQQGRLPLPPQQQKVVGGGGGQGDEASPDKEKKKSVRLAADGELAVQAWCLPQPSGCTRVQA